MPIDKNILPVSYLLFTTRGRINRITYWRASLFIWSSFYVLFNLIDLISYSVTLILLPILFWALLSTASKRLHDVGWSSNMLWIILIPVVGFVVLIYVLGFKKGKLIYNRYGTAPHVAPDYFKNPDVTQTSKGFIVDDVTQINPTIVSHVVTPNSIEELQQIIKSKKPICIGGGRFSMGGQTASAGATHIDMRKLNRVIEFSRERMIIKVEAGTRWCDIQAFVDAHNLSVKIMQTYANFTVGGSLSVNVHGRYVGLGPLILSVESLDIILASGELKTVSREKEPELFFACVGCYNAVAVIVTASFELTENVPVLRNHVMMRRNQYKEFFFKNVRNNKEVVFHNGDIYPPLYKTVRAVSWVKTDEKPNVKSRLMPLAAAYPLERYFIGAFSRSRFGKWRRENIIDPLVFASKKIHWRNYEAGYDVAELEPDSRQKSTYVLQEYFAPVQKFDEFATLMAEIFQRHDVNVINVSIRHALPDSGSLLAWAPEEVFAFVVWYKQGTSAVDKNKVGVWTRELIDGAISVGGAYYLPYQVHASERQFHRAYPNAKKLFDLKSKLDPEYKFRNVLWDTYYTAAGYWPQASG